jgi:hypothetical protein
MSYSRWGSGSAWFTFYHACSGDKYDDQYFEISNVATFTYKELKTNLESCLSRVRNECPKTTDVEIEELKGYINEFFKDVETDKELKFIDTLLTLTADGVINLDLSILDKEYVDKDRLNKHYQDALLLAKTSDSDLPLLIGHEFNSSTGDIILNKRLKGL